MEIYVDGLMKATFLAAIIILFLAIIRAQEDKTLRRIPVVLIVILIPNWVVVIGIYTLKTVQEYPNAIRWVMALIILAVDIYWIIYKLRPLKQPQKPEPPRQANNHEAGINDWPFHTVENEHEPEISKEKKKKIGIKTIFIGIFIAIPAVALLMSLKIFAAVFVSYFIIGVGVYFMDALKKFGKLEA